MVPLGPGDHPRSRGVYASSGLSITSRGGSSPLARGLPERSEERTAVHRIIPARAGFTTPSCPRTVRTRDHPRSRGVYVVPVGRSHYWRGSSPLARGLPRRGAPHHRRPRIIPARAGFTTSITAPSRPWRDHPRSRGVYDSRLKGLDGSVGSSPLARGLLLVHLGGPGAVRIIPARAGFTSAPVRAGSGAEDHPRSRGVYYTKATTGEIEDGSSPLARGLRRARTAAARRRRIIPARAGFTAGG